MNMHYYDNGPYVQSLLGQGRELRTTAQTNRLLWVGLISAVAIAAFTSWQLWQRGGLRVTLVTPRQPAMDETGDTAGG